MCVPAAIAVGSLALKAGGDIVAASAQNKAAKANKNSANAAEADAFNSLALRGAQEKVAAINDVQAVDRKTAGAVGLAQLSSAEAGVTGHSVDALQNELKYQNGMYHDSVAENLSNQMLQLAQERKGIVANTQGRIAATPRANPFAVGLKIAGEAIGTAAQLGSQSPAIGADVAPPPGALPEFSGMPKMTITPNKYGG